MSLLRILFQSSAIPSGKDGWSRNWHGWLLIGVVLILGIGVVGWQAPWRRTPTLQEPTVSQSLVVPTVPVVFQDQFAVASEWTGRIEPARQSRLSFELDGRIEAILCDEGEKVRAGQPVARLDTTRLQVRRIQVAARLDGARAVFAELENGERDEVIAYQEAESQRLQAQLALARINVARNRKLLSEKAIGREAYDQTFYAERSAQRAHKAAQARLQELRNGPREERKTLQRANVAQIHAELQAVEVDLDKSVLYAPFSGVIGERVLDEGAVIRAGDPVFTLFEMDRPEARIGIAASTAAEMTPGETVSIQVRDDSYSAKLQTIRPDLNPTTRTVEVLFRLDSAGRVLRSGELAVLQHDQLQPIRGAWLPVEALTASERGLWSCYVPVPLRSEDRRTTERRLGPTHRIERRELELLHTQLDRVYVRGALQLRERVVSAGIQRLVPGLHVRLAQQPKQPEE